MELAKLRDVFPRIACHLGVKSLQALFRSYKMIDEEAWKSGFWRVMLQLRFGLAKETVDKLAKPRWAYMHLYYLDYKRCDEIGASYWKWTSGGLSNYYMVTTEVSLDRLKEQQSKYCKTHIEAILSWGFWFASVQRLVDIFRVIKPEEMEFTSIPIQLTLSADRRAVVREAIVLCSGVSEPKDKYGLLNKAIHGTHANGWNNSYSRLMDFIYDPYPGSPTTAPGCQFPDDWIVMLDCLAILEKSNRWLGKCTCFHTLPIAINNPKYKHLMEDIKIGHYDKLILAIDQMGSDMFFKVINNIF